MKKLNLLLSLLILMTTLAHAQNSKKRVRDYGIEIGVLRTGEHNAITDVPGVTVGHTTLVAGDSVRTGVTAILPHQGNIFQQKVPAAIFIGNGFGKLAGYSQVKELGNIETPIILTNTLSIAAATEGLITYTLDMEGNEEVGSVNSVVGETNDGYLNDIRGRHVKPEHIRQTIEKATDGPMQEGNVGAGTGTSAFGYKGGIGTASRVLPAKEGGYTIGVLVQSNFGGVLEIAGVPVAKEFKNYPYYNSYEADGSCMIVVLTDAPLDARNLERLAERALLGLGKTGGIASNGSGDYVIAVSTAEENRVPYDESIAVRDTKTLNNEHMTPLFLATIEATEEAILNSMFAAEDMTGRDGNTLKALPVEKVMELMREYNRIKK
ncbi:MAG: P1 family peptidase [Cyclobacteriaceae bacterium]